jgi:hypothetical protein
MSKNKIGKYLKYAIGEIFLVMMGILLALQVSNWNDSIKRKKQLNSILSTVLNDLKTDTIAAKMVIDFYKEVQTSSTKIINKEITANNYKECPLCPSLVTIYRAMPIQKKGFELLKNFTTDTSTKKDTLATNISQFYNAFTPLVETSNDFVKTEVLNNLKEFKNFNWFIDWTQGKVNTEAIAYFTESEDYRKRVASHQLLAAGNHLRFVEVYNQNAKEIIKQLNKRLEIQPNIKETK